MFLFHYWLKSVASSDRENDVKEEIVLNLYVNHLCIIYVLVLFFIYFSLASFAMLKSGFFVTMTEFYIENFCHNIIGFSEVFWILRMTNIIKANDHESWLDLSYCSGRKYINKQDIYMFIYIFISKQSHLL